MKKILVIYGTRPEYLKVKNFLKKNDVFDIKSLHIKQHSNIINFGDPDYLIEIENKNIDRLNNIFSEIFLKLPEIIKDFDYIVIQGDTASVMASAVCAFNLKKKIIYIESGLRTWDLDNPFPEEGYRQMVARISYINFCPTERSNLNLIKENINQNCFAVGNTSLDNLLNLKEKCSYQDKVLITLHRNENLNILSEWLSIIDQFAREHPELMFIFPAHLNPIVQTAASKTKYLKIIKPLEHEDLLDILKDAKFVITDSGGIQEEACFLNKKIIVCRKTTERPEGISTGHIKIAEDPSKLKNLLEEVNTNFIIDGSCPYGDGQSTQRILRILANERL